MRDNPAARLHDLMERGRTVNANKLVYQAWGELLNVNPENIAELMAELSLVLSLPQQIREEVTAIPDGDPAVYLEHLPSIEHQLYFVPFKAKWRQVLDCGTPEGMYGLKVCADRLHAARPQPTLDDDQLTEIGDAVRDLFDFVAETDLPDELRAFILKHLHAIETALRQVHIVGLEALNTELLSAIGDFVVNRVVRDEVTNDSDDRPTAGRLRTFLLNLVVWASLIHTAATGVGDAAQAIDGAKHTVLALLSGTD